MRTILLSAPLSFCLLLANAGADQPVRMAVWYPFDSLTTIGHSVGPNTWTAYPLAASLGEGRWGKGLVLPGRGSNGLYLPNPVSFFGREARTGTIALWVKLASDPASEKGQRCLIDFMRDTGNTLIDGYEIVLFTDGDRLKAKPQLVRQMEIPNPLRQDVWTHLTLTWDCEKGTALYVNGEKKAEINAEFKPTPLEADWPGRVGCHTPGGGYPFAGTIDELRLFNYRLTDEEVRQLPWPVPGSPP